MEKPTHDEAMAEWKKEESRAVDRDKEWTRHSIAIADLKSGHYEAMAKELTRHSATLDKISAADVASKPDPAFDLSVCDCECGCRAPLSDDFVFKIPVCYTCSMNVHLDNKANAHTA